MSNLQSPMNMYKGLKELQRRSQCRSHIEKLVNNNKEITNREDMKLLVENSTNARMKAKPLSPSKSYVERREILNVGSEEVPDIITEGIKDSMLKQQEKIVSSKYKYVDV